MALTPEELQEMEQLEAELSTQQTVEESQTSGNNLTEAEIQEMALLESELAQESVSSLESAAQGVAQGVSLGFSDEIEGAVKAGLRSAQGDTRAFGEIYAEERDLARKDIMAAKAANPTAFTGAEIVSGIGLGIASGGTAALAGMRGALVLGGLTGVGMSNKTGVELVSDAATGATIGAALQYGGEKAFKGIGQVWKSLRNRTPAPTAEAIGSLSKSTKPGAVRLESKILETAYKQGADDLSPALYTKEFLDSAAEELDQIVPSTLDDIHNFRKDIEVKMDTAIAQVGNPKLSITEDLNYAKFASQSINEGDKRAWGRFKTEILDPLEAGRYEISGKKIDPNNLSPRELRELKKDIFERIRKKNGDTESIYSNSKNVAMIADGFGNDLTNKFNGLSDDIANLNKQYSNSFIAEETAPSSRDELIHIMDVSDPLRRSEKALSFINAVNEMGPDFANAYKDNYEGIINLYSASKMAREFRLGISTLFEARAAGALTNQVGLGPSGVLFALGRGGVVNAANYTGKIMKAFKMPRNVSGVLKAPDMVVKKIMDVDRGLAIALNDAIVNRDVETIEQIMTTVAENAPGEMEAGIGFEGRISGPAEAEMLKNEVLNSGLSAREQMSLIEQINSGRIPQPTQPRQPFRKVYQPRKRNENGRKI